MNKKTGLLLSSMLVMTALSLPACAFAPVEKEEVLPPVEVSVMEYVPELYPTPDLEHAVASYKAENYTGAVQELLSYLTVETEDARGFYYLALALANLGDAGAAIQAYEKVISLNESEELVMFASKGKDCLTGGPLCTIEEDSSEEVDEYKTPEEQFIEGPFEGDGFSQDLKDQIKFKRLQKIQKTINQKDRLSPDDVQEIKDFDKLNEEEIKKKREEAEEDIWGSNITGEKIALADGQVSNADIVSAINTLRDAGMTVTIQPTAAASYQNPQMAEMNMMLGGSYNNNNNNDPMAQMLPYMMQAGTPEGAQNVNPQVIQAMMMNSMLSNLDFNTSDNN